MVSVTPSLLLLLLLLESNVSIRPWENSNNREPLLFPQRLPHSILLSLWFLSLLLFLRRFFCILRTERKISSSSNWKPEMLTQHGKSHRHHVGLYRMARQIRKKARHIENEWTTVRYHVGYKRRLCTKKERWHFSKNSWPSAIAINPSKCVRNNLPNLWQLWQLVYITPQTH